MHDQETKVPPYEVSSVTGNHTPPAMYYQTPYQAPTRPARPGYSVEENPGVRFYPVPIPLRDLGHVEALVDCPYCGCRGTTKTKLTSGNMNHAWAGCLFFTTLIFTCVPYMCGTLKNVEHRCRGCGKKLAVWHRSGKTETK